VTNRLPTRAEATDVANAILDGTDCLMLSAESAMGHYPEEAVSMLARIAAATESRRPAGISNGLQEVMQHKKLSATAEAMASVVEHSLGTVPCSVVIVPTRSGTTARMISRFKPSAWIAAVSQDPAVCQALVFSYGVCPVQLPQEPESWRDFAAGWMREQQLRGHLAMLAAGPSDRHPEANHRIEFMLVGERPAGTGPARP